MNDIDTMDMIGFIKLRAWSINREKYKASHPKKRKIDEVWNPLMYSGNMAYDPEA